MKFESRVGKVTEDDKVIYSFVTDMRNFKQFIPADTIKNWEADIESCRFELSPLGQAGIKIIERDPCKTVKFAGEGLNGTEFFLWLQLKQIDKNDTRVKLTIKAELNPMLKMMATKPINDFLEKVMNGLEGFNDWSGTKE